MVQNVHNITKEYTKKKKSKRQYSISRTLVKRKKEEYEAMERTDKDGTDTVL